MKPINITHIFKHTKDLQNPYGGLAKARGIVNMIKRFTHNKLIISYGKVNKENRSTYFTKVKMTSFDIRQTIEDMEKVKEKPSQRCIDYDYGYVLDILNKVLKDRLEFRDMILDTSDEFKKLYYETERVAIPTTKKEDSETKAKRMSKTKKSQRDWVEAFNKTKYGVEK